MKRNLPSRQIDSRMNPLDLPTISLHELSFKEDDFERRGQVEIHCIPSTTNLILDFFWWNYQDPDSFICVSDSGGGVILRIRFGDKEAYEKLSPRKRKILTGIENLFHARAGHVEGYDGRGQVPLSIPPHLRSGGGMKDAKPFTTLQGVHPGL